jgi:hypothetical protein
MTPAKIRRLMTGPPASLRPRLADDPDVRRVLLRYHEAVVQIALAAFLELDDLGVPDPGALLLGGEVVAA